MIDAQAEIKVERTSQQPGARTGSAPKYTGKNINPLAAIAAAAMLLDNLGEEEAGWRVEDAVRKVVAQDLKSLAAGQMGYSTTEVGDLVVKYIDHS